MSNTAGITAGGAAGGAEKSAGNAAPAADPSVASKLDADDLRTTRYSDVCGGTDELKRLLVEEPTVAASVAGRATLRSLLDDGMYMLARMEVRLREYQVFRDTLERLAQEMRAIEEPRLRDASATAGMLRALLAAPSPGGAPLSEAAVREIVDHAEDIRQVANDMEGALRRHKEAAIAVGGAYLSLRGTRGWQDGEPSLEEAPLAQPVLGQQDPTLRQDGSGAAGSTAAGTPRNGAPAGRQTLPGGVPEAWLPPSPHREVIVDWLHRGRAVILSDAEAARFPAGPQGHEPLVQFEDGGVMPLRVVRWSTEVRNFYPLGATPHPRGSLYRQRDAPLSGAS